ncbi:MAG: HIT family protein [Leptospirales bacterium]
MNVSCFVCRMAAGNEQPDLMVFRDELVSLYHMPEVDLPGYLVLATVRHLEGLDGLTERETDSIGRVQQKAARAIQALPDVRKVYLSSFGEVCPHLHFHLFPRTDWMLEDASSWTDGEIDGPRIFDLYRKKLKTVGTPERVFEAVREFRKALGGARG